MASRTASSSGVVTIHTAVVVASARMRRIRPRKSATGPIVALIFAMLADASDYSEWKTGRRATGLVFSAGSISFKFGTGVAGAATGWILTAAGYVANVQQSGDSLHAIRLLISLFPAAAAIAAVVLFRFYPIDDHLLETIEKDLAARQQ